MAQRKVAPPAKKSTAQLEKAAGFSKVRVNDVQQLHFRQVMYDVDTEDSV